jgi:hypothetical protein
VSKPQDEIGAELLAHELKVDTVVALTANHRPGTFVTSWVRQVVQGMVVFYSGAVRTTLCVRVNERGEMFDDVNHRIRAYQFLGKTEHRVVVRTFLRRAVLSEKLMLVNDATMEDLLPAVAKEHAHACADGSVDMVELEFLDETDPLERFFRIGTNPEGMVLPIEVDLLKRKPNG